MATSAGVQRLIQEIQNDPELVPRLREDLETNLQALGIQLEPAVIEALRTKALELIPWDGTSQEILDKILDDETMRIYL